METNYGVKVKAGVAVAGAATLVLDEAVLGYGAARRHHLVMVHTFAGTSLALQGSATGTHWVEIAKVTAAGVLSTGTTLVTYPHLRLVHVGATGCTVDVISKHVGTDNRWA